MPIINQTVSDTVSITEKLQGVDKTPQHIIWSPPDVKVVTTNTWTPPEVKPQ